MMMENEESGDWFDHLDEENPNLVFVSISDFWFPRKMTKC
jgi:hypothetical protein